MKTMTLLAAFIISTGSMTADEIHVNNVTIPQGSQVAISIALHNPDNIYTAGQMIMSLPEGVTAVLKENGEPLTAKGERMNTTNHGIGASHLENGTNQFTIFSISSEAIPYTEGELFSVMIQVDASIAVGTVLEGTLTDIEMTTLDATPILFNNQIFTITISEPVDPRITLDENSTMTPEVASEADVRVLKSLVAGEWSTIVLPFAMTTEQLQNAFGEDVLLADFTAWSSKENDEGDVVSIRIECTTVNTLEANRPYVIKVSANIDEFIVDGVNIEPEEEPTVQVGKKKAERGYFTGVYLAGTTIPEDNLYLDDGVFCYSDGSATALSFCGYFELADVLADTAQAPTKVVLVIDEAPVAIMDIVDMQKSGTTKVYDLQGHRLKHPTKGIVIIDGKKVLIK